ncbi:MAG: RNA-binding cell elongation regulator Jag/EloR [Alkalispirochaeta sp.]
MVREFEGRSEQEAIDAAVEALGLDRHEFEVEILETQKSGFLGLNRSTRIRVHFPDHLKRTANDESPDEYAGGSEYADEDDDFPSNRTSTSPGSPAVSERYGNTSPEAETDFEHGVVDFVTTVCEKMGFPADVKIMYREPNKLGLRLDSEHANILIGRKGKNLDALQLLANVIAGRFEDSEIKVILDTEGYRGRREEQLIRLAQKVGDQVLRTRGSKLLEPMNPFERRLIHTTLNDIDDIGTESEGEGLYKQVRIFYRGSRR